MYFRYRNLAETHITELTDVSPFPEKHDSFSRISPDESISYSNHVSLKRRQSSIVNQYLARDYDFEDATEDLRLANWRRWLELRRQLETKLEKRLGRKPPCLVMNSIEERRYVNEEKRVFNQAKVYIEPDKYRGNPYDWLPPLTLSNKGKKELPDCEITRTRLEKGIIVPLEYVDSPAVVRQEKLTQALSERPSSRQNWDNSPYVQQKQADTLKVRKYRPRMDGLVIKGESILERIQTHYQDISIPVFTVSGFFDLSEKYEEASTFPLPIADETAADMTVRLQVQKTTFSWNETPKKSYFTEKNTSFSRETEDGEFNLKFDAKLNEKCNRCVRLENSGTTKLTYWWKKREGSQMFPNISRASFFSHFFFNKGGGVLVPGNILQMPIWFHSRRPGIFEEYWELMVLPRVTNRSDHINFRFWGIAIDERSRDLEYAKIESYIQMRVSESQTRAAEQKRLMQSRCPDVAPVEYKIRYLDEKFFYQKNPNYYYHPRVVETLASLYKEIVGDSGKEWNFDIRCLRNLITSDKTDPKKQQERLDFLCDSMKILLYPCFAPSQTNKHVAVRNILSTLANNIERVAENLKIQLNSRTIKSATPSPSGLADKVSVDSPKTSDEKIRRITQNVNMRGRKRNSDNRSRLGEASKNSSATSSQKSSSSLKKSQIVFSEQSFTMDEKKYAMYKEALFVKVYYLLGTAVEQISSVLDSIKTVE